MQIALTNTASMQASQDRDHRTNIRQTGSAPRRDALEDQHVCPGTATSTQKSGDGHAGRLQQPMAASLTPEVALAASTVERLDDNLFFAGEVPAGHEAATGLHAQETRAHHSLTTIAEVGVKSEGQVRFTTDIRQLADAGHRLVMSRQRGSARRQSSSQRPCPKAIRTRPDRRPESVLCAQGTCRWLARIRGDESGDVRGYRDPPSV